MVTCGHRLEVIRFQHDQTGDVGIVKSAARKLGPIWDVSTMYLGKVMF